jgi:hypothetical protein
MEATLKTEATFEPFSYKFASRVNPARRFEIRPYTAEDLEVVLDQLCTVFAEGEPLSLHLGITKEMWYSFCKPMAQRCVEENLGVACVDQETGKIAVSITSYDIYYSHAKPFFVGSEYEPIKHLVELLTVNEYDDTLQYKQFNDVVELFALTATKEYQGLGLAKDTMDWIVKCHPIMSKTKVITISATNPLTKIIMDKTGWETRRTICLPEYKNTKGETIFATIKEDFNRKKYFKDYTDIHYGVYLH